MAQSNESTGGVAFRALAARTCVVLVEPLYGGNVGAVARSMNNFGFSQLRLVTPRADIDGDEARRMAMYSGGLLDSAQIYESLEAALDDIDIAVGTTRRMGRKRSRFFRPCAMAEALAGLACEKNAAVLFGPEDAGLSNKHLEYCDWLVTIDTFSDFDSLNIAHSVTVILYEISRYFRVTSACEIKESKHLDGLCVHIGKMLKSSGFIEEGADPKRVMLGLRRMLSRGRWSRSEIDLFHAVLNSFEKKM